MTRYVSRVVHNDIPTTALQRIEPLCGEAHAALKEATEQFRGLEATGKDIQTLNDAVRAKDIPEAVALIEPLLSEKLRWPGVPIMISKRDIDGALKRV